MLWNVEHPISSNIEGHDRQFIRNSMNKFQFHINIIMSHQTNNKGYWTSICNFRHHYTTVNATNWHFGFIPGDKWNYIQIGYNTKYKSLWSLTVSYAFQSKSQTRTQTHNIHTPTTSTHTQHTTLIAGLPANTVQPTDKYLERIANSEETWNYTAICGVFVRYCSRQGSLTVGKVYLLVLIHGTM
jgi:hypothetical protein